MALLLITRFIGCVECCIQERSQAFGKENAVVGAFVYNGGELSIDNPGVRESEGRRQLLLLHHDAAQLVNCTLDLLIQGGYITRPGIYRYNSGKFRR